MKVIAIRGLPGSGKTTLAQHLADQERLKGSDIVKIINRDEIRYKVAELNWSQSKWIYDMTKDVTKKDLYDLSFKVKELDKEVNQQFWYKIAQNLIGNLCDTLIIDITFTSIIDIGKLRFLMELCGYVELDVYEMTTQYESKHDVPNDIMRKFKLELDTYREHIKKLAKNFYYVK